MSDAFGLWWKRLLGRRSPRVIPAAPNGRPALEGLEDRNLLSTAPPVMLWVRGPAGVPFSLRLDAAARPEVQAGAGEGLQGFSLVPGTQESGFFQFLAASSAGGPARPFWVTFGDQDAGALLDLSAGFDGTLNLVLSQDGASFRVSLRLPELTAGRDLLGLRVTDFNRDGLADLVLWTRSEGGGIASHVLAGGRDGNFLSLSGLFSFGRAERLAPAAPPVAGPNAHVAAAMPETGPQSDGLSQGDLPAAPVASHGTPSQETPPGPPSPPATTTPAPAAAEGTADSPSNGPDPGPPSAPAGPAAPETDHDPAAMPDRAPATPGASVAALEALAPADPGPAPPPPPAGTPGATSPVPGQAAHPVAPPAAPASPGDSGAATPALPASAIDLLLSAVDAPTVSEAGDVPALLPDPKGPLALDVTLPHDDGPPAVAVPAGLGGLLAHAIYLGGLNRVAGEAGAAPAPAESRLLVADLVQRSTEAFTRLVQGFYRLVLGRLPADGEEQGWVDLLLSGKTEEEVLSGFLGTAEFAARADTLAAAGTSDERFVQAAYRLLLLREPTDAELAGWLGALPSLGRTGVASFLLRSVEYRGLQITSFHAEVAGRPATEAEVADWAASPFDLLTIRGLLAMHASPSPAG
jgi:hypothetical protein